MRAHDTKLRLREVAKSFTMHLRGGAELPVVRDVSFEVAAGECVVLGGPSGAGKSSILKMIYGNYRADRGEILLHDGEAWVDIIRAGPRQVLRMRKCAMGYVSQFLRAIPAFPRSIWSPPPRAKPACRPIWRTPRRWICWTG